MPGHFGSAMRPPAPAPVADLSRRWYALVLAGTALSLLTGNLVRDFTADTYLMALCSTQTWQPFFWGQNRYGMFIPLLLGWLRDFEANLLAQTAVHVLCLLGCFHFFCRLFFPGAPRRTASLALLVFAVLLPDYARQMVNVAQPYAPAALLTLAGIAALRQDGWTAPTRWLLFGLGQVVSFYINIAGLPFALGTLLALALSERRHDRRLVIALAVTVAVFALNLWLVSLNPLSWTDANAYRVFRAPQSQFGAGHGALDWFLLKNSWLVACFAGLAVLALALRRFTPAAAPVRSAWWLLGLAAGLLLLIAFVPWVAEYYFAPRYFATAAMLWAVATAGILLGVPRLQSGRGFVMLMTVLLAGFIARYRPGSYWPLRDARLRELAPAVEALRLSGAPMFCGDFEECWPVVFWANVNFQRSHISQVCYGLSNRSIAQFPLVIPLLTQRKSVCLAAPAERFEAYRPAFGFRAFIEDRRIGAFSIGHCEFADNARP